MIVLKEYTTKKGEQILYNGNPNFDSLEELSEGVGDIWHSSFEQGYKNAFPELVYQTATFFWFLKDFDNLDVCVSWRINPNHFAVRKSVWEALEGFDSDYKNVQMQAFDFGYNALRISGAIPLYIKGLFESEAKEKISISAKDRYTFFVKNFKIDHSIFMIYRGGFWKFKEWNAFFYAKKKYKRSGVKPILTPRELNPIKGNPTVSYIIPTMMRQDFTLNLLDDLSKQHYKPTQVVIVDATPIEQRDSSLYDQANYSFELIVKWQETKGSCRARNEAIAFCNGDYVIFGDDDIRLPAEYIKNHISFLQTYGAGACNGLDVRADHEKQNLDDLKHKLDNYGHGRFLSGVAQIYNNANNCVKKEYVDALVGNDVNYDGGYGEDIDYGFDLLRLGVIVLQNPYSTNLHLKPPVGGYRFWGNQAKIMGKKRKKQPWELDKQVKWIRPIPSPTLMYYYYKQFGKETVNEYRHKYFFLYLFKGPKLSMPLRFLKMPYRQLQFNKSIFYAKKLLKVGKRTQ